ncbi:MAG TPA: sigma-70 family RNA polymerase sigma factor [Thermomicrobiales bacterium]|nr:sigma-70 family RNA polymerase sigma factor [Thermomicrobiales bacterium]
MPATIQAFEDSSAPPESGAQPDGALVLAARQDLAAFEALYRRYAERVYRYCLRRLDDPERAADTTSAIFIKAMQSIDHCQPESFRSWLFSIAHNATIDARRTTRDHAPLDRALVVSSADPGPEELITRQEATLEIVALLGHLTPDQRPVVELRLAGLDGYEIAQALGRSRASVDTAQSRAVARLRRVLTATNGKEASHVIAG